MSPVSKALPVAVWVTPLALLKSTSVPALTVSGVGWYLKLAIRTVFAPLAVALAVWPAAARRPTSESAAAASARASPKRRRQLIVEFVIAPGYGGRRGGVQISR